MKYIEPHAHMVSRTTDDYERMALSGAATDAAVTAIWTAPETLDRVAAYVAKTLTKA